MRKKNEGRGDSDTGKDLGLSSRQAGPRPTRPRRATRRTWEARRAPPTFPHTHLGSYGKEEVRGAVPHTRHLSVLVLPRYVHFLSDGVHRYRTHFVLTGPSFRCFSRSVKTFSEQAAHSESADLRQAASIRIT